MANRLAHEVSPYLQQHKDNPVDWYPWGEEALARARAEDRPILLSVGYSACHWCHVMEHESFADPQTAALMNELFVNVKVDREERPDIDSIYMQAVQQMTGHGGWPMTVFLQPNGAPFYGGTYFPPEPRHGLPSFRQVLLGVADAYRQRRSEVEESAASLRESLASVVGVNPAPGGADVGMLQRAFHRLAASFDHVNGGFGNAPKFPQPMLVDFLLRYHLRTGSPEALDMCRHTLTAMADGGIFDHLGGGFHRYSVDARWLVPHFEKMLYDNAQLARVYVRAFQVTGDQRFRRVAEDTLDYLLREMSSPSGGFYSSQDADSEGVEGKFYVWTASEVEELLGPDAELFEAIYDVTEAGNWEHVNILNRPRTLSEVTSALGVSVDQLEESMRKGRETLYRARSARVWPGRDEKIITAWNALAIQALAEAGRAFDRPDYSERAAVCAHFIHTELRRDDRLKRSWRDGTPGVDGFLEDHALLIEALLELYTATFHLAWIGEARWIADRMIERFWSPEQEIFFDTASDAEALVVRPRDIYDNATPSGTSAAAHALLRLAHLVGEPLYGRIGRRVVESMGRVAIEVPHGFGHMLCAIEASLATPTEVVIVGQPDDPGTLDLLGVLRKRFLPQTAIALRSGDEGEEVVADVPILLNRSRRDNQATAYVCRGFACRQPVTTSSELSRELDYALRGETAG